jgi:hypothetical protein
MKYDQDVKKVKIIQKELIPRVGRIENQILIDDQASLFDSI